MLASGRDDEGDRGSSDASTHLVARIDLPAIQRIRGILRLTDTGANHIRQKARRAQPHTRGHDYGDPVALRDAITRRRDLSHVVIDTTSTAQIPLARDETLETAEADADEADLDSSNHDRGIHAALSFARSGDIRLTASDAPRGPPSANTVSIKRTAAQDPIFHYIVLSKDDLPHHTALGEIQHIREFLDRPQGRYWLQASPDHLRCPHCIWTLDRTRCRPFSNLGAPRKYDDTAEKRAGRAQARKVARQKKLRTRRASFWAAIREEEGHDEYFMTQSAWWREIDKLKRQRDSLQSTAFSIVDRQAFEDHRTSLKSVIGRIQWCEDRVRELKRIVHT